MPFLANLESLRNGNNGYKFEGNRFGEVNLSFFYVDAEPGAGPDLHFHPYEEVFVILEGQATFTIAGQTITASSGDVLLAPPNTPHKFINSGTGRLRTMNIHPSDHVIQEMVT
jgi:quercetin dioxygenase-like cupin family protein